MSNKAHDHVHRLVRAMTSAEKRYFKLYASRHRIGRAGNNVRLFDAIGSMSIYDEPALLERFAGSGFIRSFAITKRRLYETILNSLDAYHATGSSKARARRMLHQVEILNEKGLYDDAAKILTSVRRSARAHDMQAALLEVAQFERRAIERGNYDGAGVDTASRMVAEAAAIHQEMMEVDTLWLLKSRLFQLLYRHGKPRDEKGMLEVSDLMRHPLLGDVDGLRSARARFLFCHVHSAAAFALGDLRACEKNLEASQRELERSSEVLGDEPSLLLGVLSNRIHVLARLGRTEQAFKLLEKLRNHPALKIKKASLDLQVKVFATRASLELSLLAQQGEFKTAVHRAVEVEQGMARYEAAMSPLRREGLCFQLAYVYFGAGMNTAALRWSNRQLNESGPDLHSDLNAYGRMLNILLQVEMGKKDLLPYAVRNAQRAFKKRKLVSRFETAFFDFLKARVRARTAQDGQQALNAFRAAIVPLEHDPLERHVFDHFDPLAWVDARLSGRAFDTVVKERARSISQAA